MQGQLNYKNIAIHIEPYSVMPSSPSLKGRSTGFKVAARVMFALLVGLKLFSPLIILTSLFFLACASSDIERAEDSDGGPQGQYLLIDDFEECALDPKWSSWGGLKLKVQGYSSDPPDKTPNPDGSNCYLQVDANNEPDSEYPGAAMIYIGKNAPTDGFITLDMRIDSFSGASPYNGQIMFDIVDDDNIAYTINISADDIKNGGDDLLSHNYIHGQSSANDWVRISIPLSAFIDVNGNLGDNILNTDSQSTSAQNAEKPGASDAGVSDTQTSTESNGGLLALRIRPSDKNFVLSIDNVKITSTDESEVIFQSAIDQDGGADAGTFDGGDTTDGGDIDGGPSDGGDTDGGPTDGGTTPVKTPPYSVDDAEGLFDWWTFGGASASFTSSLNAPSPPAGLNLGGNVIDVTGTSNNTSTYPGGIGHYIGGEASSTDFLTFSIGGQGAAEVIVTDNDEGVGIDYFKASTTISSDAGQFSTYGWRTYSLNFGSAFSLDTAQNTHTGIPQGDGIFNPSISSTDFHGLKDVTFVLQTNSDALTNSQVHLYLDNIKVTTSNQGDGIPDLTSSTASPFDIDGFDDGDFATDPAWFHGDGIQPQIQSYDAMGIAPASPDSGSHFLSLFGPADPDALYGGFFGTFVGKAVNANSDFVKLTGWDLSGSFTIQLEFNLGDEGTRQYTYSFADTDMEDNPEEINIPLSSFLDVDGQSILVQSSSDGEGSYQLDNFVVTLGGTADTPVNEAHVNIDDLRIEP